MTKTEILTAEQTARRKIEERAKDLSSQNHWKDVCGPNSEIIDDGCMDPDAWAERSRLGKPRILWVLKEHNGCTYEYGETASAYGVPKNRMRVFWDMHVDPYGTMSGKAGFRRNVNKYRSLKLIEIASRMILTGDTSIPVTGSESDVSRCAVETFRKLAFVEVGKTEGGARTSNARLELLCKAWGDIVKEQILSLKPTMIIVAGKQFEYLFKRDSDLKSGCAPCSYVVTASWKGIPMISTCHPGYWLVCRKHWVLSVAKAALQFRK